MPTMKDVAALAGVSVGTVSNVLAGLPTVTPEMRNRVEVAVRELRYQPDQVARSLKTRRTRTLGMVVSDILNPFFADVISGAEDAATRRGYALSIVNSADSPAREARAVETLCARRIDGLLAVVAIERGDHRYLQACLDAGVPVVCLDRKPDGLDVDTVSIDNAASAGNALRHLLELGHRRVAFIGGSPRMYVAPERLQGYLEAMRDAGLPPIIREGDFSRQSGRTLTLDLMAVAEPPTAVLCGNLQIALGVMQALRQLNLEVPRDLAIATFDYFEWLDVFHPQLTAIVQPAYQIGFEAAELLIQRLLGLVTESARRQLVLPTTLRIAESTAGAPRG